MVYGVADSGSTGEEVASRICETVPDCQLVRFDRSGHWPFLEEPERFSEVLMAFFLEP